MNDDPLALSQRRWRGDEGDVHLTWGVRMTGKPFVDFMLSYAAPNPADTIVEIGPGYGRITSDLLERQSQFARYIGLELSPARVTRLRQQFSDPRMEFREADLLALPTVGLSSEFTADLVFGSAVFEHFYPHFGVALSTIASFTRAGGKLVFDLVRFDEALNKPAIGFDSGNGTYVRVYTIAELVDIFRGSGFLLDALGRLSFGMGAYGAEVLRTVIRATRL